MRVDAMLLVSVGGQVIAPPSTGKPSRPVTKADTLAQLVTAVDGQASPARR